MIEIPENVNAFVKQCGDIVAAYQKWELIYSMSPELVACESPIEQLFLAATHTILNVNALAEGESDVSHDIAVIYGVSIRQQAKIGNYRVDFRMEYTSGEMVDYDKGKRAAGHEIRKIVVELDGHEFHDTNEKQRRYEKARDRFLQKKGYKVFHYTGAEVVKDPFAAAAECVAYLVDCDEEDIMDNIKKCRGSYVG